MDSIRYEKPRKIRWIELVWKVSSSKMLSCHKLVVRNGVREVRNLLFFFPLIEERFLAALGATVGCSGLRFGGARFEAE